jgi:uncharacterized protein
MKRLFLIAIFACFAAAPTHAAQPTDAQIDALMETMDMRRTLDEMFAQIETASESMGLQMLGENATPEQRDSLRRITASQQTSMREALSWDRMGPIYRRIYARLFTAEEIDAMIAFYGSDTGRAIMRKMPQAMQMSMEEMGPVLQGMLGKMQKTLETELQNADEGAHKGDRAP